VRISGLWEQSGVTVATIKFYLREGLLPPGVPTGRNQAEYDDTHLERLRLIRILTSVGRLTLSEVRDILATLDHGEPTPPHPEAAANGHRPAGSSTTMVRADEFFHELGWQVDPDSPEYDSIAYVLGALRQLGCDVDVRTLAPYAMAAARVAEVQRDCAPAAPATVAARAALFEVALLELVRMAQKRMAQKRGTPASG
jgi:DNA-binding transcriptional MerR regulator